MQVGPQRKSVGVDPETPRTLVDPLQHVTWPPGSDFRRPHPGKVCIGHNSDGGQVLDPRSHGLFTLVTMAGRALTVFGAVNARSFRRLPAGERFVASELEKVQGPTWDLI